MERLVLLARAYRAKQVLEIGAGTGNNTGAFLAAYPCALTAVDMSAGMLSQARAKGIEARWLRAVAESLPLPDSGEDFAFGVYMLHFIKDLRSLMRECRRVLRGGGAAFVTASHSYIERHPLNAYFPSFAGVDKARFPTVERVEDSLLDAGFANPQTETFVDDTKPIDARYLAKVEGKFISTLELLPPAEYETGLHALRDDIAARGQLDAQMAWESVVVWAEAA